MKQILTPDDINQLGTIVSVWAHPDDETFTCGGLLATAARNGQTVVVVTATHGEAGIQDPKRWPADKLAEIRTHELEEALSILGIKHHHWLRCHDGHCAEEADDELMRTLANMIEHIQPDTILTFGPEGLTGHPDHQEVSKWVDKVVPKLKKQPKIYHLVEPVENYPLIKPDYWRHQIFFKIDQPPLEEAAKCDICYCLDKDVLELKIKALRAMPSQYEALLDGLSDDVTEVVLGTEALVLK